MKTLSTKIKAGWAYMRKPPLQMRMAIQTLLAVALATSTAWLFKLSMPFWAAITSVFLVTSHVGATIDKSLMRIVGTVIGAVLGVILVVLFAQHILWIMVSLVLLIMVCCYYSTMSRYQYAFILLPVTAVMVALIAAPKPELVYSLAISRTMEVLLGVGSVWLVTLFVFPNFVQDKMLKDRENLLMDLKQSFIELVDCYLANSDQQGHIAEHLQQINQKLNSYKKSLLIAGKELKRENFDALQVIDNIRNMRFILAKLSQFSSLLKQKPELAVPESILVLLKKTKGILINIFECAAKPADLIQFNNERAAFLELMHQIYYLREEERVAGHIYQCSIKSNANFYAFLELLEKIQYHLAYIVNNEYLDIKPPIYRKPELTKILPHFWSSLKALPGNIIEIKHSLKVALAASLTMLIWYAIKSPAIVTGLVSVLVVAQLNIYSSHQKARSRILGCLLGGTIGILLIALPLNLLFFYLLSALTILSFAYLSAGKGNLIDIGIQANVALSTAVITQWGAQLTAQAALGRVAGVLLGSTIAVMVGYFVWPLNPVINLRKRLAVNYNKFARWMAALNESFIILNKESDLTLLRRNLIDRLTNTESLLAYLTNNANDEVKYRHLIELQYKLYFNLLSFEQNKNNLESIAIALNVDIQHYFQQAGSKLLEFSGILSNQPVEAQKINIQQVLHMAKEQFNTIRKTAKMSPFKVQQVKEFMVVINELIQLLIYLQSTEVELFDGSSAALSGT